MGRFNRQEEWDDFRQDHPALLTPGSAKRFFNHTTGPALGLGLATTGLVSQPYMKKRQKQQDAEKPSLAKEAAAGSTRASDPLQEALMNFHRSRH